METLVLINQFLFEVLKVVFGCFIFSVILYGVVSLVCYLITKKYI